MTIADLIPMRIHSLIQSLSLREGDQLPDFGAIADSWKCDLSEVYEAISAAESQGLLIRDGKGVIRVPVTPVLPDPEELSFANTARQLGIEMKTKCIAAETTVRLPFNKGPLEATERRAQVALGLRSDQPFIVIPRIRYLDGKPRAVHRVYLAPARFSPGFLDEHDFSTESLIAVYRAAGYQLGTRDTTLIARIPNLLEVQDLELLSAAYAPVLVAEQSMIASHAQEPADFVLEYMLATYLQWQYRIQGRPTPPPNR